MNLTFHSDSGHGWLEVPLATAMMVGTPLDRISPYSYAAVVGTVPTLYLEEDCDICLFLDAAKAAGKEVNISNKHHDGDCFVRQLPRYQARR